jgi:hypothetical protein
MFEDLEWSDTISSMRIPAGYEVDVFNGCYLGRTRYTGPKDVSTLGELN